VSNSVITCIELRVQPSSDGINHFWDAFRFQKVERKWKMTGCLLLGLPDEKVTKIRETPTGPKEKRIPTSFIDDMSIMLTLRFFIFKYSL